MRLTPSEIIELNRYLFNALKQKRFDVKLGSKSGAIKSVSKFDIQCLPGICNSYEDGRQEYSYICLTSGTVDSTDLGYYTKDDPNSAVNKYSDDKRVKIDIRNYQRVIDAFVNDLNVTYMTTVRKKLKTEGVKTRVKIKATGDVFEGKEGFMESEKDGLVTVLVNFDDKGRKVRQLFKKENIEYFPTSTLVENLDSSEYDELLEPSDTYVYNGNEIDEEIRPLIKSIVISPDVTQISEKAFSGMHKLESVTIPPTVRKIQHGAFGTCVKLTRVNIPSSVVYIGHSAFWNCSSLKTVTIPSSVSEMSRYVFTHCDSLKKIYIEHESIPSGWDPLWKGTTTKAEVILGYNKKKILKEEDDSVELETIDITDEKTLLLSNHLEIDPALIIKFCEKEPSYNCEEYRNYYYVLDLESEYIVCDYKTAYDMAIRRARNDIADNMQYDSSDGYIRNFIDMDKLNDIWQDSERDRLDYMDEIEIIEEAVNLDIISGDDFEEDENGRPDYEKPKTKIDKEDLKKKVLEKMLSQYSNGMEWLEGMYGDREISTFLSENNLYDEEEMAEDMVASDGYGRYIASYDEDEISLGADKNGENMYAYRIN